MLDRIHNSLQAATRLLTIAAGWALLVLSLTIAFEVAARKLFRLSLQGVDEYGGYALAIGATLGCSYALYQKAHIRIDVIVRLLPSAMRATADLLALMTLNIFVWILLWQAVEVVLQSYRLQAQAVSPLRTPLVLPQGIWAAALALFAVAALVQLVRAASGFFRADWPWVTREFGTPDVEEEVALELEATRRRLAEVPR